MDINRYEKLFKQFTKAIIGLLIVVVGYAVKDIWKTSKITTQIEAINKSLTNIKEDLKFVKNNYVSQKDFETYMKYLSDYLILTKDMQDKQVIINDKLQTKYETLLKLIYNQELKYANQSKSRGSKIDTLQYKK